MSHGRKPTSRIRLRQLLGRRDDVAVYPSNALDSDEPPEDFYFYRPGEVLVPDYPDQVGLFEQLAGQLDLQYCRCGDGAAPTLRGKEEQRDAAGPTGVAGAPGVKRFFVRSRLELEVILRRLERAARMAGQRLAVTPNHVVFGCPVWGMDPFGDPGLPGEGDRVDPREGGAEVVVAVVDSGVPTDFRQNPLLGTSLLGPPAVSSPPSEDEPWPYSGPVPVLVFPQGHGSFVAGVVRQAASRASVRSYRALDTDGVTDEWYLGYQLSLVLEDAPQVINLSLGTTTRADEKLMGLAVLEKAATRPDTDDGPPAPIVVAAAGNLGDSRPFYPAAEKWTISVGAIELTGPNNDVPVAASFSNFGPGSTSAPRDARLQLLRTQAIPTTFRPFYHPRLQGFRAVERDIVCGPARERCRRRAASTGPAPWPRWRSGLPAGRAGESAKPGDLRPMTPATGGGNGGGSGNRVGKDEDSLLQELREVVGRLDPPPALLAPIAEALFTWHDPDAELADLVADSRDLAGAVRGGKEELLLRFEAAPFAITLEASPDPSGSYRVIGHVEPSVAALVEIRQAVGGQREPGPALHCDEWGRFEAYPVAPGLVSLRLTPDGGRPVLTTWVVL